MSKAKEKCPYWDDCQVSMVDRKDGCYEKHPIGCAVYQTILQMVRKTSDYWKQRIAETLKDGGC